MIRALFNHRAIEVLENFRVPAFLYDPQNDMIYGNQQFSLISETLTLSEDKRKHSIVSHFKSSESPADLLFSTEEDSVTFQFSPVEVRSEGRRIWFCFLKSDTQKNSGFVMAHLAHKKKLEELNEMSASIAL